MGRKKKVVENTAVNPEAVEKEVVETEKKVEPTPEKKTEEPIKAARNNMITVKMLADVSIIGVAEYIGGQIVTVSENIYNQIMQSCVKM